MTSWQESHQYALENGGMDDDEGGEVCHCGLGPEDHRLGGAAEHNYIPKRNLLNKEDDMTEASPPEPISQFFAYEHLPPHLQEVSKPFGELANFILTLPRNAERTVALRKLLEAKDAAVRAKLAK